MIRPPDDRPSPPAIDLADAAEAFEGQDRYTVHLDRFEGPLDLLLYLIQRDEIDIYDIPIAHITHQYLESIETLDVFNLDNAGEFIVMAATLMRIKARLLLPVQAEDEDDDFDPRDELVRRLLEYKRFKEAAGRLGDAEESRRDYFRIGREFPFRHEDEEPPEFSLSLTDLLSALRNVVDHLEGDHRHHVYQEIYTVDAQMEIILGRLEDGDRVRFEEIFTAARVKMEVVVTFVAMLELMKAERLQAYQLTPYGEIWLSRRAPQPADAKAKGKKPDGDLGKEAEGAA